MQTEADISLMTLLGLGDLKMDIAVETLTERLYSIFINFLKKVKT